MLLLLPLVWLRYALKNLKKVFQLSLYSIVGKVRLIAKFKKSNCERQKQGRLSTKTITTIKELPLDVKVVNGCSNDFQIYNFPHSCLMVRKWNRFDKSNSEMILHQMIRFGVARSNHCTALHNLSSFNLSSFSWKSNFHLKFMKKTEERNWHYPFHLTLLARKFERFKLWAINKECFFWWELLEIL